MRLYLISSCVVSTISFANPISSQSVENLGAFNAKVVEVHSGDSVTVRTSDICIFGSDCIDGRKQVRVRLPSITAPKKRQKMSRESYLSLLKMLINKEVIVLPKDTKGSLYIGDIVTCYYTFQFQVDLEDVCNMPELEKADSITFVGWNVKIGRGDQELNTSYRMTKETHPQFFPPYRDFSLIEVLMNDGVEPSFRYASTITFLASESQILDGLVHVDPKYTSFDSPLFMAQEQAKSLRKGIWSLPSSEQIFPWDYPDRK